GGCDRKGWSGGGGGAEEVLRLDLGEVAQELKDNRPAALNRYVGKTLEMDVERITIAAEGVTRIILRFFPATEPGDSMSVVYEGTFRLDDPRNNPLKGAKTGPFRAVVRGVLVSVREEN